METLLICYDCGEVIVGCEKTKKNNDCVIQKYCKFSCEKIIQNNCKQLNNKNRKLFAMKCEICQEKDNEYYD